MAYAQLHQSVFSGEEGQALLDKLVDSYKPVVSLNYGETRDTLYLRVYRQDDSVHCVYTDHTLHLPNGVDPSTHLLKGGTDNGINTEHVYPRSKGAEFGAAKSDMHHLFPTRARVNTERGNSAFAEIDDSDTDLWFYKVNAVSSPPAQGIDLYSEKLEMPFFEDERFEPREDFKGDVARAVFYFYTMYKAEADAEDPFYFFKMCSDLCSWHQLDPVDSLEWIWNQRKAPYQDNKVNPYILDSTVAMRTFCSPLFQNCKVTTATGHVHNDGWMQLAHYPNPFSEHITFHYVLPENAQVRLEIRDVLGQPINVLFDKFEYAGEQSYSWNKNVSSGIYMYTLSVKVNDHMVYYKTGRIVRM